MNIFIFCEDVSESAKYFFENDFRRANKQILEATQLIAHGCNHFNLTIPKTKSGLLYKVTNHQNHPCTRWVKTARLHLQWLYKYTIALCESYSSLKNKTHTCQKSLWEIEELYYTKKNNNSSINFCG